MSINQEKIAKEIYFKYCGSKFQMMRDGVNHEYIQYQISEAQEKEWLIELIEKNIDQLNINNKDSLYPLWYIIVTHCASTYIERIIDFIYANKNKAENKVTLTSFISKTEEIINRIDKACSHIPLYLNSYRKRIELLKQEGNL